jgi:hypothetical protein
MSEALSIILAVLTVLLGVIVLDHSTSLGWYMAFATSVGALIYFFLRNLGSHAAASVLRSKSRRGPRSTS